MISDCTLASGLFPYQPSPDSPWDLKKAQHVYRRMGFSASKETLEAALLKHPQDLVDEIINDALEAAPLPTPPWADWVISDYDDFQTELGEQVLSWALLWLNDMFEHPFRGKLTLFWHNHYVTRLEQYACASWMYRYYRILEGNALGNFRTFTEEIGKTPAMLVFLNGVQNTRISPNENYARELFELFTLGRDQGYTENDIKEAARALTGWNGFTQLCAPISFNPLLHDSGSKTIFGRTGNWDYNGLHQILFEERKEFIARHICRKLYGYFVSPDIDEPFVQELAQVMLTADFELEPVYRALFKSERFFDAEITGTIIKSPFDLFVGLVNEIDISLTDQLRTLLLFQASELGQMILNPPDVAGWQGDKSWIDTSRLTQRWIAADALILNTFTRLPLRLSQLSADVSSSFDDEAIISREITDFFLSRELHEPIHYERAEEVFKWEIPQNYFDEKQWNLQWETVPVQTAYLLQYICRLPEFQLI
jgi:hypothetical protein